MSTWLENLWGEILSEDAPRIRAAFASLDTESQGAVYAHLQRMATEDGWADSQRAAASAALDALTKGRPPDV